MSGLNRNRTHIVLSLAAPLMVLLGVSAMVQREGADRWQALPAIFVGSGLVIHAVIGRRQRRHQLLIALRPTHYPDD